MVLPSTFRALAQAVEARLARIDPETAGADARYVLKKRADLEWASLISAPDASLPKAIIESIESDLARHEAGEPLSRIYNEREFWGLNFSISPETLDPRPDTEVLVRRALECIPRDRRVRILDLGTGTGCVLLAIVHERPLACGIGVDRAFGAALTAQANAMRLGLAGQAQFVCGNWADALAGGFDLVVSNPPYIANPALESLSGTVRNHDPILALAGGDDGLGAYRIIFQQLPRLVKSGGRALFEIGFDQGADIMRLIGESRFLEGRIWPDTAGRARVAEMQF